MRHITTGSTIAVVAPSGAIDEHLAQTAIDALQCEGYNIKVMPHVFGHSQSVFSATDEERAADLRAAIEDESIDAIICARGGYGAVRTLQHLGDDTLAKCNKWLLGFSDITALHSALGRLGLPSLHGPMLKHIATHGMHSDDVRRTFNIMQGKAQTVEVAPNALNRLGQCSGRVVGGNLSLISTLRSTPVDIDFRGAILFIEDLSEYLYHIDRMMQNLKYSGALSELAGLVVGQFTDMKNGRTAFDGDAYSIIRQAVDDYAYPVVMGYPAGHSAEINMQIEMNKTANLRIEAARVELEMCEGT